MIVKWSLRLYSRPLAFFLPLASLPLPSPHHTTPYPLVLVLVLVGRYPQPQPLLTPIPCASAGGRDSWGRGKGDNQAQAVRGASKAGSGKLEAGRRRGFKFINLSFYPNTRPFSHLTYEPLRPSCLSTAISQSSYPALSLRLLLLCKKREIIKRERTKGWMDGWREYT